MTFATIEASLEDAQPVFLYRFTLGAKAWYYTSNATDVLTIDGKLWTAAAISDDGVKQTGEAASDSLSIEAPTSIGPVQLFMGSPPSSAVGVTIFHKHASNTEVKTVYVGEISQVSFGSPGAATINCETLSATMRREGLRLGWQRSCPYALYDEVTCKVDKTAHMETAKITAISGFNITVATISGTNYRGGFVEWTHPSKGVEFRAIESQAGSVLTIFGEIGEMYVGLEVKAYRGCNRTPEDCQSFSNYANYGGVPAMPGKSPFDGVNSNPFY